MRIVVFNMKITRTWEGYALETQHHELAVPISIHKAPRICAPVLGARENRSTQPRVEGYVKQNHVTLTLTNSSLRQGSVKR